ncbi:BRO-N domain-containing protein [Acinetobacter gerneri]|uniref:BRO-N domain-containing protein n=1 Tax=Acinetobacter gerneri TaxID=202952 RepID=UPI0028B16058|nr:BRO family protein [Acinetobacter gerneri]
MTSLALSFNEVKFNPVVQDNGQIYLTASELAQALNYKSVKSVTNLFNANKDEFTPSMSMVIESVTNGINNSKRKLNVRIFSLRGCHLIAFFARTNVAKAFRKWALDILDKEVGQPVAKTHKSERTALHEAHALLVTKTKHLNSSQAWKLIHQRFNVNDVAEIPYDAIPIAVEYVHHLIALYSSAERNQLSEDKLQNMHALATHMIWVREWWREFGDVFKKLNPVIYGRANHHFSDGSCLAWRFVKPDQKKQLEECVKSFDWITGNYQQKLPI